MQTEIKVNRKPYLAEKVVIVEGQAGCGKTMLSPIVAALDRVELLTYAYELEHICALHYLGKVDTNSAATLARMWTDLQLYNAAMGRETNFRPSDLSSIFRDRPWRYLKRILAKGDEAVVERVKQERPILHLTAHNFLEISEPVFAGLGQRAVLIEVVRHPLYMIKQQALNMERLMSDVRLFTVNIDHNGNDLPFWAQGWEELFLKSNAVEKAIYSIKYLNQKRQSARPKLMDSGAQVMTVPFESFVLDPWLMLKEIATALRTTVTAHTRKVMKKQRVPRKQIGAGLGLKIYKRCGWEPPRSGSEADELNSRRAFAAQHASAEAMAVLDQLCAEYEEQYLSKEEK